VAKTDGSALETHLTSKISAKRCPNFPSAFGLSSSKDLYKNIASATPIRIYFRKTIGTKGGLTSLWALSKAMLRLAKDIGKDDVFVQAWAEFVGLQQMSSGDSQSRLNKQKVLVEQFMTVVDYS
jgi:hypothetical protein